MVLRRLGLRLPGRRGRSGGLGGAGRRGTGSRAQAVDLAFARSCVGGARPRTGGPGTAGPRPALSRAEWPRVGTGSLPHT